jgi:hypothetical protein
LILPRDYRSMPVTKIVIASQAKQSSFAPDKKAGLLHLAHNDGRDFNESTGETPC